MCELRKYEHCVYSQNGADGIIAEILRRIEINVVSVEIGAHHAYGNCYLLAEKGSPVLFVERDRGCLQSLIDRVNGPNISYKLTDVTVKNVNVVVPSDASILSIDIDGNDYWIWEALSHEPEVIVIEFNAFHPQPVRKVIAYDPCFQWNGSRYFGASLSAMSALGVRKGYTLIATDSDQANAYFVSSRFETRFERVTPEQLWYEPKWTFGEDEREMVDLPDN